MTRRIGFGNKPRDIETTTAPKPVTDTPAPERDPRVRALAGMNWKIRGFILAFLGFWLAGWTTGMVFVAGAIADASSWPTRLFLIFWLLAATAGWVFAVYAWFKVLRAK